MERVKGPRVGKWKSTGDTDALSPTGGIEEYSITLRSGVFADIVTSHGDCAQKAHY